MQLSTLYLCELGFCSLTKYKYINIFFILYTKCTRKFLCFTVRREPKAFENRWSREN
jgi:hypothetical protein